MREPDLRVYGVFDPERCGGHDPIGQLRAALAGGVTLVQLRAKSLSTREFVTLAWAALEVCSEADVPLLINDRVDVALAVGAAGVHLGQSDLSVVDARRLLGEEAMIGVTVHHGHEARLVDQRLADYAGVGPVYATSSKDPGDPPIGPAGLRLLRLEMGNFPICGIAGIDFSNAGPVIEAGADGVAVISDLFMGADPEASARRLRRIVDEALSRDGVLEGGAS